jgi:branched-chain amino acid transport system permease protein
MISATLLGQSVLSGLFSGCLYALLGLGLTLSWRYLRIINLAHFALIFLAAYIAYWMNSAHGLHPLLTCLAIVPAFFALGVAQQLLFIRFKVGEFASVIVTFGLTIIVESLIQFIWSADFVRMETHLARGSLEIGKLLAPWDELFMSAVAISVCVATWACLNFTWLGKALRASLDNPDIAASFGVPNRALALLVSGAAASFAAIGGVFVALLYTLTPSSIYSWFGVVLATVLLGGLGSPLGAIGAGLLIGVGEALTMAVVAPSWAPVAPFTLLILILVLWPERI